jgi:hypothetical protein
MPSPSDECRRGDPRIGRLRTRSAIPAVSKTLVKTGKSRPGRARARRPSALAPGRGDDVPAACAAARPAGPAERETLLSSRLPAPQPLEV